MAHILPRCRSVTAAPGMIVRVGLDAVLFDMDGTLLDSEKIWDVALDDLAEWLGGTLSAPTRAEMVGNSLGRSVHLMHRELGLVNGDETASGEFLSARAGELFASALEWRPGAEELLAAVHEAGLPIGLVTSTQRALTEIALETLGRHRFTVSVCGDEIENPKPAPDPYLRAAELLSVPATACVAVEDSPTGVAAAVAAGCVVLAVPIDVPVEPRDRVVLRDSLVGLGPEDLAALLAG